MCIPDNLDLFNAHDLKQQSELDKLPVCDQCDEPIQDDYCYDINDVVYCEKCLNELFRKHTEDYL